MTADCFDGDAHQALDAALAVEVFHNFSLIHDDIMDAAPLRRGHQTVHEKWDLNTGILSGDAMLIMAYQLFENYHLKLFKSSQNYSAKQHWKSAKGSNTISILKHASDVSIPEYLKMIEYKTAVLVGAAMKMGAIIANASTEDQDRCYEFGRNLGIAFQLQDDYLDAFGNPETFGKQVGGDIIENKKTYLFLKAIENGSPERSSNTETLFSTES